MLLSIDPSSTISGYCVMDPDGRLAAYGEINTATVPYEGRWAYIIGELEGLRTGYQIDDICCEMAVRFEGKRIPALEVVTTSVRKWGKRYKMQVAFYSPGEWKRSAVGDGRADKEEVARVICLQYPELNRESTHVTDSVGIALHHAGVKRLLRQWIRLLL